MRHDFVVTVGAASMSLVDDDEIKGVRSKILKNAVQRKCLDGREKKRAALVLMIPGKKAVGLPVLRAYDWQNYS